MTYCPYTDRTLRESEVNSEHVIPLSLGGIDGFEILVDAGFNAKVGSELEGALAKEFIWALARTKYDARGHSGKDPKATIKNATYGDDNRAAQVHFHSHNGLSFWDVRDRAFKNVPGTFSINTSLSIDLPVRFAAKVALAAGYYAYGDLFRESVDHQQLRDVMLSTDLSKLDLSKKSEAGLSRPTLTANSYLHAPGESDDLMTIRLFCSAVHGSVVMLILERDVLSVVVGILGKYLAMVRVPANVKVFPNSGEFDLGHVIAVSDKKLYRTSVADGLRQFVELDQFSNTNLPLTPMLQMTREFEVLRGVDDQ